MTSDAPNIFIAHLKYIYILKYIVVHINIYLYIIYTLAGSTTKVLPTSQATFSKRLWRKIAQWQVSSAYNYKYIYI